MPDDALAPLAPRRADDDARPTPNLFIVGAPKSGTTALASYLGAHPEVFVAGKELSYFGSDLVFRTTKGGRWRIGYDTYLEWFARHGEARYRTDRSVFYLFSSRAAAEIHDYDPGSRVIALLRNPVDQMHSQHSEMLFQGDEDIASFEGALAAEEAAGAASACRPAVRRCSASSTGTSPGTPSRSSATSPRSGPTACARSSTTTSWPTPPPPTGACSSSSTSTLSTAPASRSSTPTR